MSTDDSVSEDVSSSGALSHCHVGADGDMGGKESEASLVSSEGTSASGPAVSHERRTASQTTGGTVEHRPLDITPACNKIRTLCLSTEAFEQEKNLPFINPSSLETLRVLVQEIQSSGETDPEIWKDCEGRWLHLFQLVEKQYQEQILAQQEQYQCQIQLIQDEIKALVQLQNRQASVAPPADFTLPPPGVTPASATKNFLFPLISSRSLDAPGHAPFSSPPLPRPDTARWAEERATTVLSSGYGTLSAWASGLEPTAPPGDEEEEEEPKDTATGRQLHLSTNESEAAPPQYQQKTSSQQLTSWAQRHKLRPKRSRAGPAESQEQPPNPGPPETHTDPQDQPRALGPTCTSSPLRRSDSLMSEASGLTYWRLNECDLYRPLPDSFDSGAFLLLQEASLSPTPPPEPPLSLKEIYRNKQRGDPRRSAWDHVSSPQVLTLDAPATRRQSDRTSGFTSPSHFSSPSFAAQPLLSSRAGTPDSTAGGSPHPADTDCTSDASSGSAAAGGPSPSGLQGSWGKASHSPLADGQQGGASEVEEGSYTHTSTLKPRPAGGARLQHAVDHQAEKTSSVEDPVVLSLLRQNLREKHSRHVADLKAYYESEIQILRDRLRLRELPQDLERSNQILTQRCKHLEDALTEAMRRVEELEAANSSLHNKLEAWPERYALAGATVTSLQRRLEESRRSCREKEAAATRLRTRVRQLEEEAQGAGREAQEKEARREREHRMLQELLGDYDSLMKEHEVVKNNLVSAESRLVDANDQTAELKRVISKLEAQVKQLEHENQARARHVAHGNTPPSGAGLFHHPDLLLSPGKGWAEPDVTRRRSPCPPPEQLSTPNSQSQKRSSCSSGSGSWRCASPPDGEGPHARHQEGGRREAPGVLTPVMRALIQLEETRATESRAPWGASGRSTVGLVERRHKESIQAEREAAPPAGGAAARSHGAAALLRAQRSLSPEGHRSSSLPPPGQRHAPPTTPTKRETLQAPLSAKSSPKRCPTENYSTAFGHLMPRQEHLPPRTDTQLDRRRHSFHSSPRKRLHFTSAERDDDRWQPDSSAAIGPLDGSPQLGWGELGGSGGPDLLRGPCEDAAPPLLERLQSLGEAERLFDELTQEKLQVEAALSRVPGSGPRVTLQTRSDQVALENRLERLNRELGSLRMTLKRFHVLRSSANT